MKREKKKQKDAGAGTAAPESPVSAGGAGEPATPPAPAEKKPQKPDRERPGEGSGAYTMQPGMIGMEKSGLDGVRILQAIAVLISIAAVAYLILSFL